MQSYTTVDMNMAHKPILIDALHICMGGGLMILNHLINNLVHRGIDFVLLKDKRCPQLQSEAYVRNTTVLSAKNKYRKQFYKAHCKDFAAVVCFGNIPPAIRLNVPVYTYFHNVSLLKIPKDYKLTKKIFSILKRFYIKRYAKNTDGWIVQTNYTASLVKGALAGKSQRVYEYPFYWIPSDMNNTPRSQRTDYIYVGDYTQAKGHDYLLEAWIKLSKSGFKHTLHMTVTNPEFTKSVEHAAQNGVPVVNHGKLPFDEIVKLYNKSKATVYPSLNESLGLGIVEAVDAGCDVIGVDLPYMHSVCKPTGLFKACDATSIAQAVMEYEKNNKSCPSELTIRDTVGDFISFINQAAYCTSK